MYVPGLKSLKKLLSPWWALASRSRPEIIEEVSQPLIGACLPFPAQNTRFGNEMRKWLNHALSRFPAGCPPNKRILLVFSYRGRATGKMGM